MNTETAKLPAVTREDFEPIAKRRHGSADLPNGKRVIFQSLRRSELYAFDAQFFDGDGKAIEAKMHTRPARMMALVLCDLHGKRLFSDDEWEAIDSLPSNIFEPIWDAVRKHLGLDRDTEADEGTDPNS